MIEVFGPAGFGSSRIVSEALGGHHQVTTLRVDVIDSSTPLLAARRLVEALGGVGAWESISLEAFGRRTKHIAADDHREPGSRQWPASPATWRSCGRPNSSW